MLIEEAALAQVYCFVLSQMHMMYILAVGCRRNSERPPAFLSPLRPPRALGTSTAFVGGIVPMEWRDGQLPRRGPGA